MTDREKRFLAELGFTPGEWEWYDNTQIGTTVLSGGRPEREIPILYHILMDHSPDGNDRVLIKKAPELFISLFHAVRCICNFCAVHNGGIQMSMSEDFYQKTVHLLEKVSGETWNDLGQIWGKTE